MPAATAKRSTPAERPEPIKVTSVTVIGSTEAHNHATIRTQTGAGPEVTSESVGPANGPIDALCKAFYGVESGFKCIDYRCRSLGEGSDAEGLAAVRIRMYDGKEYEGTGQHTNTLAATAVAIADALHKHFVHLHHYPRTKG